jgi:tight adherence protein B
MTRRPGLCRSVAAACLVAALAAPAAGAAAPGKLRVKGVSARDFPTIRTTVLAPSEATPAPTLTQNGNTVQRYTAEKLSPKGIVLAIDRSRSMLGAPLRQASAAARRFVQTKPHADRIAVISFGADAFQLTSFSTATIDADQALRTLAVDSRYGTALYDAVVLAAQALDPESTKAKIAIVLTDGRNYGNPGTLQQAIATARRDRVAVYPIAIKGPQFTPKPLQRLARATGGTYYTAASLKDLAGVYDRIAAELRRTWLLEYVTAARPGETIKLRISAHGARQVTTEFTIPTAVGTPTAGKGGGRRSWPAAVVIGLLAGALLFGAGWFAFVPRRATLSERLEPYMDGGSPRRGRFEEEGRVAFLAPLFRVTERAFAELRLWSKLELLLARADVPLRTVEFVYVVFGCGFVPALIAALAGQSSVVILVLFAVGAALPLAFVSIKARRRRQEFERQLSDALNTIAASLKAGHSFLQALQTLVEESAPPLGSEFRRALAEHRLGRTLEQALLDMGLRVDSRELDFVLRAVVIQRQVGGSLAGLFEIVADTVSQRQNFRAKIKSITAMGRFSAMVLIVLPFAVAGLMALINAGYLSPLFHTGIGQTMVVIMLVMMLIGSLIIRKIVSFRT